MLHLQLSGILACNQSIFLSLSFFLSLFFLALSFSFSLFLSLSLSFLPPSSLSPFFLLGCLEVLGFSVRVMLPS
jgi:hypothetical protein